HDRRLGTARPVEPHLAVRPDPGGLDRARRRREQAQLARDDLEPVQRRPAFVVVREQERGRVGPPTRHPYIARQVDRAVASFAARQVPYTRPVPTLPLHPGGGTLVTRE